MSPFSFLSLPESAAGRVMEVEEVRCKLPGRLGTMEFEEEDEEEEMSSEL